MNNYTCPSCGGQKTTQINDREYRCEYCGHTFIPTRLRQTQTQQQISSQSSNYSQQSFQSQFSSQNAAGKNRLTAAILGIILGCIGAHHFYLGNNLKGVIYLIFCWTYIPTLLGIIEGIMLLTQSDEDFAFKPKLLF